MSGDKMAKCGWGLDRKRGGRWDGVYYKYLFVSKTRRGEELAELFRWCNAVADGHACKLV